MELTVPATLPKMQTSTAKTAMKRTTEMATMTPAATTITQMAQLYDKEVSYATAINTITTIVCLVTMPLLTMLYYL